MNLSEVVQSSGWKNFMAKLYGWGATVVIVGALFKIQHWPGAGIMLSVGLLTEGIIFFFSAFEPLHEELDWTLVYPELAGMTDPDEIENIKEAGKASSGHITLERFEDLVQNTNVGPEAFKRLGESLTKLNTVSSNLADVSEATVATTQYANNMKNAANSVGNLAGTFSQSASSLQDSISSLSTSYSSLSSNVKNDLSSITEGTKNYNSQVESLNKNLAALNAVYELQLRDSNNQFKETQSIYSGMNSLVENLKHSAEETQKYREEVGQLSKNLSSLNSIYGNMLSAMNVFTNKK
jgi:gliding motility-associated protein GldL